MHQKSVKSFGGKGKHAPFKDLEQQHARKCFLSIAVKALSEMKKQVKLALMHLAQKHDQQTEERLTLKNFC